MNDKNGDAAIAKQIHLLSCKQIIYFFQTGNYYREKKKKKLSQRKRHVQVISSQILHSGSAHL